MKLREEEELEKKARRLAEQKYQEEIKLATTRAIAAVGFQIRLSSHIFMFCFLPRLFKPHVEFLL